MNRLESPPRTSDTGSVMILTLFVLALVTALSTTLAVVTVNNLQATGRAQQGATAQNAAEAGVAQTLSWLRQNGVSSIPCTTESCAEPVTVPDGTASYRTWVVQRLAFDASTGGEYEIHSLGFVGPSMSAQASRKLVAVVRVNPARVPRGVFARNFTGNGDAKVVGQSVITTGCVRNRSKIEIDASTMDLAYGIPAGVHSSSVISNSKSCDPRDSIHAAGACPATAVWRNDHDIAGGALSGDCASLANDYKHFFGPSLTTDDPHYGSYVKDDAALFDLFGIDSPPKLSDAQLEQLRATAQLQGNLHFDSRSTWYNPVIGPEDHAVLYFDLRGMTGNREVDLSKITGFEPDTCPQRSLVVIIEAGDARLAASTDLAASVFLISEGTYGKIRNSGNSNFVGTLYADTLEIIGTTTLTSTQCFASNMSPSLLDIQITSYQEMDRVG